MIDTSDPKIVQKMREISHRTKFVTPVLSPADQKQRTRRLVGVLCELEELGCVPTEENTGSKTALRRIRTTEL